MLGCTSQQELFIIYLFLVYFSVSNVSITFLRIGSFGRQRSVHMGVVIRREGTDGYHYIPGREDGYSVTNTVILFLLFNIMAYGDDADELD